MKKPSSHIIDFPYPQINSDNKLVEIFDNHGQAFLLMPLHDAIKKKMPRRAVFVILKDYTNRVLITKFRQNTKQKNTLWNLSSYGDIFAGESAEGTAHRILEENFNILNSSIQNILTLPFMEHDTTLHTSIFMADIYREQITPNQELIFDSMFVDKDELTGLLEFQPEMFHSILIWVMHSNRIFN